MTEIQKIISGGQTGADRAALDSAIERGIPHGGWCPKGRKAEDGPLDGRYQLKEPRGSEARTTRVARPAFQRHQLQPPLLFLAQGSVRIAEFSMAVPVVDHVVAHSPQIWGLMEAISEV